MGVRVWLVAVCLGVCLSVGAQEGIQSADVERAANPCVDFDIYANGAWRAGHVMPPTQTSWSRKSTAADLTRDRLKGILETASSLGAPRDANTQLIGDFYTACVDQAKIDARGLAPLRPILHAIDAMGDRAALEKQMLAMQQVGLNAPVELSSTQDPHAPEQVIAEVSVRGLGLPDRDYYLREEQRFKAVREKYVVHVERMFLLLGYDAAAAKEAAAVVLRMETRLAEPRMTRVEMRDPKAQDHPITLAELQALAPHYDWAQEFAAQGIKPAKINLGQPKLTAAFDAMFAEAPMAEWKTYLKWVLIDKSASALPRGFGDEVFVFQSNLTGAKEQRPRDQRCAIATDRELGEALGRKYVEQYFPPEAKARVREMAINIAAQLKLSIESRDWMTPETKAKAVEKIDKLNIKVGYPDTWKDYRSIKIGRDTYFEDLMETTRFAVRDDVGRIGKPLDRGRWGMTPPTANAYYNPQLNEIVLPAGYLQVPGFNLKATDPANYGAIGVTIGHEISHGVDDEGAQFAADGSLTNWWKPADYEAFKTKTACTARQYDLYFVEPGVHHNGKLVLGEALGDLGGVNLAYRAYKAAELKAAQLGKPPVPVVDGFTPDQQFFLAEGQWRGALVRPETMRTAVQVDPHPVAKWRVLGPLSNMPEFASAFQCKAGDAMVREEKCAVW